MKVKIVKASSRRYWYAKKIGRIFEVNNKPIRAYDGTLKYELKKDTTYVFNIDDVSNIQEKVIFT